MNLRQYSNKSFFIISCFIASFCLYSSVYAATYYVAKTGSNNHNCIQAQTIKTAKLTIAGGLKCLTGGDTLIIKAGIYKESILSDNFPSGSDAGHTIIQAALGETVWIRPTLQPILPGIVYLRNGAHHITLQGIGIDGSGLTDAGVKAETDGITIRDDHIEHDIVMEGIEVKNITTENSDAIQFGMGSYNIVLRNSYIHNIMDSTPDTSPNQAIYFRGSVPKGSDPGNIVENNRIENTANGISIRNTNGSALNRGIIRNNIFINLRDRAINVESHATDTFIYNNIFANMEHGIRNNSSSTKVYNNTFYNITPQPAIDRIGPSTPTSQQAALIKNNIFYQVAYLHFIPSGNFTYDPHFVDSAKEDFRLQSSSPVIDAGITLADVPDDFNGIPRPSGTHYDLGAFEFYSRDLFPPTNLRIVKSSL